MAGYANTSAYANKQWQGMLMQVPMQTSNGRVVYHEQLGQHLKHPEVVIPAWHTLAMVA